MQLNYRGRRMKKMSDHSPKTPTTLKIHTTRKIVFLDVFAMSSIIVLHGLNIDVNERVEL